MLAGAILTGSTAMAAPLMTWADLMSRPRPQPTARIRYGPDPLQEVEVWLPPGEGPFPVVVMIHGGCWTTAVARLSIMDWAAADLRRRGIAVWNIEYRGVDRPAGGYPGTFEDVAAAADALRGHAGEYHLATKRVVAFGHSAGGHLAMWLSARPGLPGGSALWRAAPLAIHAAVSTGGLPDLAAARARGDASCGADTIDKLVGAPGRSEPYEDTSPAALPPPAAGLVVIGGDSDPISPPDLNEAFVEAMRQRGKPVRRISVESTGHAELIAPGTVAWTKTVGVLRALLGMTSDRSS